MCWCIQRGVCRTLVEHDGGACNDFCKKAPSLMFNVVLNMPLHWQIVSVFFVITVSGTLVTRSLADFV